jgi:hypothetical protein
MVSLEESAQQSRPKSSHRPCHGTRQHMDLKYWSRHPNQLQSELNLEMQLDIFGHIRLIYHIL